jgi:hypothetical protein
LISLNYFLQNCLIFNNSCTICLNITKSPCCTLTHWELSNDTKSIVKDWMANSTFRNFGNFQTYQVMQIMKLVTLRVHKILIFHFKENFEGWKYGKRAKGVKVKVIFPRMHITHVIFVVIYNLNFFISDISLTLHVRYKYVLITNWFHIMYIMYSWPLSHKYEQLFVKITFSKSILFKVRNTLNQTCSNWL